MEEDVATTRSPRDPEGNFASFCYFLRDRILNGLPRDAFFIRREARRLAARVINPVAREQEDSRVHFLSALVGAGFGGRGREDGQGGLDVVAQDAELLAEDDLAARGL
ncbi:MAG: hypothetical protein ACREWE_07640, partial [Gammaproteobacteria bacterium]